MYQLEVDFEVYKALTVRRTTEDVTYNDVIRELLGISQGAQQPASAQSADAGDGEWVTKGVRFPRATEFRASHKGKTYMGRVQDGALVVEGQRHDSPSAAAMAITGNPVNGWRFWECKLPGKTAWTLIAGLRT